MKQNLVGRRFARWLVVERVADRGTAAKPRKVYWCRCECGTEKAVFAENLTGGKSQSCGCLAAEINSKNKFQDISGQRFGRLIVLGRAPNRARRTMFWCRCDCDGKVVAVHADALRQGLTTSCGCARIDHGHAVDGVKTRTYQAWLNMLTRCHNPRSPAFYWYGEIGVTVCARWRLSFEAFLKDMGVCPPGLELDRVNPNGHYEPSNCRWATQAEQSQNTRANYVHELRGERLTQKVVAQRFGIELRQLSVWLQSGLTIEQAAERASYFPPRKPPVSVPAPAHLHNTARKTS